MRGYDEHEPPSNRGYQEAPPSSRGVTGAEGKKLSSMATLHRDEADLPPSQFQFGKPSKKRIVIIALAGLAITAGAAGGFGYFTHRTAMREASAAFSDLNQCLIGESNTTEAEVVVKFRHHQVAMMGREKEQRSGDAGEAWPDRCETYALKLLDAADGANLEGEDGTSLKESAAEIGKAIKEGRMIDNDVSGILSKVWTAAAKAELKPVSSTVIGPPAHSLALTIADLPDSAFITQDYVALNDLQLPWLTSESSAFFFDHKDGNGPFHCNATAENLVCSHLAGALAKKGHALRLLGSADPGVPPLLFAGNRGDAGIFRAESGVEVDRMASYGGYARKDGTAIAVGYEGDKIYLAVQKGKDPGKRFDVDEELKRLFSDEPPDRGHAFYNVQVAHGYMFVRGTLKDERRLWAFQLEENGRPGKPIDLGPLPEYGLVTASDETPHIAACRTDQARRIVRVHGRNHDYASFLADNKWTKLVEGDDLFRKRMECAGERALFIGDSRVEVCTSAECKPALLRLETAGALSARAGTYGRTILGDKVLAIWGAGQRGGVRAKKGAPADLATVQDTVLLDDLIDQGKMVDLPTVTELRVIGGGSHALLLVQTKRGLSVIRIKADGSAMPETVVWSEPK
jgi:hypothetical protein